MQEEMILEDGKYYPMMKAVPGTNARRNLDERGGNVWKTAVGTTASGSL